MTVFGDVELRRGDHFGDYGIRPESLGFNLADDLLGDGFLRIAVIENRRTILRAGVIALAVQRSGVVNGEEYFEEIAVGGDGGVEDDLNDLGMSGGTGADGAIG